MYPIFVFAKCCWSIHSIFLLSKHAHSKQRKATPTQTLQFHVKLSARSASSGSTVYSVFFQHIVWYGPTSETAWMQKAEKMIKIY